MSKIGSILLGVAAGTVAGIGDELKDQIDSFTRKMRDKSMELKGTLEEKVDNLLSDSDSKPEDLVKLLEKKLASLKEKVKK